MGGIFSFLAEHQNFSPELMRVINESGHSSPFQKHQPDQLEQDNSPG